MTENENINETLDVFELVFYNIVVQLASELRYTGAEELSPILFELIPVLARDVKRLKSAIIRYEEGRKHEMP